MRVARLANFVTPTSGGLRTALRELGRGMVRAGHEPVLVVPGERASTVDTDQGLVVTLPGVKVPGLGGYRVFVRRAALLRALAEIRPDTIEVSDRTTLRWTGRWAREQGIPSVMVSHESLAGLLGVVPLPEAWRGGLTRALNRRTAAGFDRVLCTTAWAAREFDEIGAPNVAQVPLGIDLDLFRPERRTARFDPGLVRLVCCTRLSLEKRPHRALVTLRSLLAEGVPATLTMVGDGPLRAKLEAEAADLPIRFTGWVHDRQELAALLADADVALAPGPIETFGLAAMEAMACGTPAVVSASSALPALVGDAGLSRPGDDFAAGVLELLERPEQARREAARRQAERFSWEAAVAGFLEVHESLRRDIAALSAVHRQSAFRS